MSDNDGVTFRVRDTELCLWETIYSAPPSSETHRIYLHKERQFLSVLTDLLDRVAPRRMIELGIFQGGSAIYWTERYALEKFSAFDLEPEAPALTRYIERHALTDRIRTHFGILQDDGAAVRRAVAEDFAGESVDVVIDDASHEYGPTRASMDILLPHLRPGGAYVIEDWYWGPMMPLVPQLPMLLWPSDIIRRVEIHKNFAILWRGDDVLPTDGSVTPITNALDNLPAGMRVGAVTP